MAQIARSRQKHEEAFETASNEPLETETREGRESEPKEGRLIRPQLSEEKARAVREALRRRRQLSEAERQARQAELVRRMQTSRWQTARSPRRISFDPLPEQWTLPGYKLGLPLPALSPRLLGWRMCEPGVAEISVGMRNPLPRATRPAWLVVRSAPLGAFADSHEVERVRVPSLRPGQDSETKIRVPTRQLGLEDTERLRRRRRFWDAIGHWIGNIDVHFEEDSDAAVERHVALKLRVPPQQHASLLMFMKDTKRDGYFTAEVDCFSPGWRAEIGFGRHSRIGWLRVHTPPEVGRECRVIARVRRNSDMKVVPVEFTFETTRGRGDRLECAGR